MLSFGLNVCKEFGDMIFFVLCGVLDFMGRPFRIRYVCIVENRASLDCS